MEVLNINDMTGGWFIGNFEPSALKTNQFEVCYKVHKKGESWPVHYHKVAVEINYLIRGAMRIKNRELREGDIFILQPGEIADPVFLSDCELIVVKIPSVKNDKYEPI